MLPSSIKTRTVTRLFFPTKKDQNVAVRVSPRLEQSAHAPREEVLRIAETQETGLTEAAAAERLERYGPNEVGQEKQHTWRVGCGWQCAIRW